MLVLAILPFIVPILRTGFSNPNGHGYRLTFRLENFVDDPYNEVPIHITGIHRRLSESQACISHLFDKSRDKTGIERKYKKYIQTGSMDSFSSYEEVADMLLFILKNLPGYLFSQEMMLKLDDFFIEDTDDPKESHRDLCELSDVFGAEYYGRALLRDTLLFFKDYVTKNCTDGGYLGVAEAVSEYFASPFVLCGWMSHCEKFSRDMMVLRLMQMTVDDIHKIFTPCYHGEDDDFMEVSKQ